MKPETRKLLDKAEECLADAVRLRPIAPRVAGREAYLAAFHAAQALIHEHTSRIVKTHRGVRAQFAKTARENPALDPDLGRVLARGYEVKEQADYGTGPEAYISSRAAEEAIEHAARFVASIRKLLK